MKSKLAAAPQTDATAEREGVWRTYTDAQGAEYRVKIARAGTNNPDYLKLSNDLMRPYARLKKEHSDLPYGIQRTITRKLYAGACVRDWNAEDFEQPFSVDNCVATMEAANDFTDWVVDESQRVTNYYTARIEEDSKN